MLDRFEIQVEMTPLTSEELTHEYDSEERSEVIRARVLEAISFADWRVGKLSGGEFTTAASLSAEQSLKYCAMDEAAVTFMKNAYERMGLSARGYDRMVRVSRTIADMAKSETVRAVHVSEALQMRSLDKKYWYDN